MRRPTSGRFGAYLSVSFEMVGGAFWGRYDRCVKELIRFPSTVRPSFRIMHFVDGLLLLEKCGALRFFRRDGQACGYDVQCRRSLPRKGF